MPEGQNTTQPTENIQESPVQGEILAENQTNNCGHNLTLLNSRQERAAYLLASGQSLTATAKEIQVHRQTLYVWMAEPAFEIELQRLRYEVRLAVHDQLLAGATKAVQVILAELGNSKAAIRLKAAIEVLRGLRFLSPAIQPPEEAPELPAETSGRGLLEDLSKLTPEQAQALLDEFGGDR